MSSFGYYLLRNDLILKILLISFLITLNTPTHTPAHLLSPNVSTRMSLDLTNRERRLSKFESCFCDVAKIRASCQCVRSDKKRIQPDHYWNSIIVML